MDFEPGYVKLPGAISSVEKLRSVGIRGMDGFPEGAKSKFPILTSEYYVGLMDKKDGRGPLRQLVIPSKEELSEYSQGGARGSFDTSGEGSNLKAPGLQHKYGPTALALISNACAGLCRECFRKRLFIEGKQRNEATFPNEKALEYLRAHGEINAILLSGGDAFMLTDDSIAKILEILENESLGHIKTVRFGTKTPAYFPQRITKKLAGMLGEYMKKTGKEVQVAVHFEHPRELSKEALEALANLREAGVGMYNQTVLLKGINDDAEVLFELFSKLSKNMVRPYYLFQCRPVTGSLHMRVPLKRGLRIYNGLMQKLSGIHKPIYAMSTKLGKMQIVGMHPEEEDLIVLRKHSSKESGNTGNVLFHDASEAPFWLKE